MNLKNFVTIDGKKDYNFIATDLTKSKNNGKYRKNLDTLFLTSFKSV